MYLSNFTGKLAEKTMMQKYGVENVNEHFVSFNTICDATQVIFFPLASWFCLVRSPLNYTKTLLWNILICKFAKSNVALSQLIFNMFISRLLGFLIFQVYLS